MAHYGCRPGQIDKYRLQTTQGRNNYIRLSSTTPIFTAHSNFFQSSQFPELNQNTSEETNNKPYQKTPSSLHNSPHKPKRTEERYELKCFPLPLLRVPEMSLKIVWANLTIPCLHLFEQPLMVQTDRKTLLSYKVQE